MSKATSSVDGSEKKLDLFRVVRKDEHNLFFGAKPKDGRWSKEEHKLFLEAVFDLGIKNWRTLEERIKTRSNCQIRSHFQKYLNKICLRHKLKKTLNEVIVKPEIDHLINGTDKKIIRIFNEFKKNKNRIRKIKLARLKIRIMKASKKKQKKKCIFIVKKKVDPYLKYKKFSKNNDDISQKPHSNIITQSKLEFHCQDDSKFSSDKNYSTSNSSCHSGNNNSNIIDEFSVHQNIMEHNNFMLKLDFLKNFNKNFMQNNFIDYYTFNFNENIEQFNEYIKAFQSLGTFSSLSNSN